MFLHSRGEREEGKMEKKGLGKGKVEKLKTDDPRLLTSLLTTEARGKADGSKHTPAYSY